MQEEQFTEDRARYVAVSIITETKKLLAVMGVTTGGNPVIKPLDLWKRLESAMLQAASGAKSPQEFLTRYLSRLGRVTPSKRWSSSIYSLLRGATDEFEATKGLSMIAVAPDWAVDAGRNWKLFKSLVKAEMVYIIVEAQVIDDEMKEARRETNV